MEWARPCERRQRRRWASARPRVGPLGPGSVGYRCVRDYLRPIYREANRHPSLLENGISGNPEGLGAGELHARAWPLVQPRFLKDREAATARYRQLQGTGRASNDVRGVVPAAHDGRIDVLFVAVGVQIWGTFLADSRRIDVGEEAPGRTGDLLNLAAVHTVLNRGTVYAVPSAEMPGEAPVAAILRY